MILHIARKSLLNRKWTFLFTLVSLMLGVALTLGINHIRAEIKSNFTKTLSGTDLVVGARSSSINLLMYSVFRLGNATNSIRWDTYQELAKHSDVKWLFPISLGDSHKGYRVVGTTTDYFTHYQYGHAQALSFAAGHEFAQVYDAVLGAEVARALGYKIGDKIAFSHGSGKVEIHHHDDKPYTVVGILESTGTPVDRSVHVSLAGIEAIHVDWHGGVSLPKKISAEDALHHDLTPTSVTAIFVGLKSRNTAFKVQRQINQYTQEPLLAIMPGAALAELWKMMSIMEDTLQLIALMVLVASLLGMTASLLATVNERRRELAILRAMGANPFYLFILIEIEILILAILGLLAGMIVLSLGLYIAQPLLIAAFGLPISANIWNAALLPYAALMVAIASFLGAIPAWMCVRNSLIGELATK